MRGDSSRARKAARYSHPRGTRTPGRYSIRSRYPTPWLRRAAPFSDNNVRLALKYAIDRQAMVDVILGGHGAARGADAADLYFQHSRTNSLTLEDGIISTANSGIQQGVGLLGRKAKLGLDVVHDQAADLYHDARAAGIKRIVQVENDAPRHSIYLKPLRTVHSAETTFSWNRSISKLLPTMRGVR